MSRVVRDPVFRKTKATAALRRVDQEMAKKPPARGYTVPVPLIRSKRPGKRALTNAKIGNLLD